MASETLTFFFDFTCPYSYLGWELLQIKCKQQPFPMTLIGIGPNPPGNPTLLGRALWGDHRWSELQKLGEKIGIVIHRPTVPATSQVALRGLGMYEGCSLTDYVSGIFKALFRENVDISVPRILIDYLHASGIDSKPLEMALADPNTLKQVEDNLLLWGHNRIRTLPTFQAGSERLAGLFDQRAIDNFLITLDF